MHMYAIYYSQNYQEVMNIAGYSYCMVNITQLAVFHISRFLEACNEISVELGAP